MKLLNKELNDKIWSDVNGKILKHVTWDSPVNKQIQNNFGWWDDDNNLIKLKIDNPNLLLASHI